MTAGFMAALLEGFEGTLDAALEQIEEGELRSEVEELRVHIASSVRSLRHRKSWN
jgi:hypothetical protein